MKVRCIDCSVRKTCNKVKNNKYKMHECRDYCTDLGRMSRLNAMRVKWSESSPK